jgi:hypothetical protein
MRLSSGLAVLSVLAAIGVRAALSGPLPCLSPGTRPVCQAPGRLLDRVPAAWYAEGVTRM